MPRRLKSSYHFLTQKKLYNGDRFYAVKQREGKTWIHLDFFILQKTLEQERIIAGTMRNVINVDSITQNAVYADVLSRDNLGGPIPEQRFIAGK